MASPVVANLLIGPAVVWYAPTGESAPADSTAKGASWGGNWVRLGYTKTPLSCNYETEELDLMVEEEMAPVRRVATGENLTLETTLAETTASYLELATGMGTATTTAPGAGQVGKDEFVLGGESVLDEKCWGFEGTYVSATGTSFPVRVFVWKGTAKLNGALEFSKADYPGTPLQIKALSDTTKPVGQKLLKFQRVTAAATS